MVNIILFSTWIFDLLILTLSPTSDSFSSLTHSDIYLIISDLSNDSFSTVNMGLDDGTSQHSGRYGSGSPPPYLTNHSPNQMGARHPYSSYMSNESSPVHNYPDFPPSPDSWIGGGDAGNSTSATNNNSTSVHYWLAANAICNSRWRGKNITGR